MLTFRDAWCNLRVNCQRVKVYTRNFAIGFQMVSRYKNRKRLERLVAALASDTGLFAFQSGLNEYFAYVRTILGFADMGRISRAARPEG